MPLPLATPRKPATPRSMATRFAPMLLPLLLAACDGGLDDGGGQNGNTAPALVTVAGDVNTQAALTLAQLQALPATTQTVNFSSSNGAQTHTYTGTSLWGVLNQQGIKTNAAIKNDVLNKYALVTGADGYKAVFALGELSPDFGNRGNNVVYAETVNGVSSPLPAADGPLRVTAPGDIKGGRYVSNVVRIDVRASASTTAATTSAPTTTFQLSGAVLRPGAYGLSALQALPVTTVTVGTSVYTGVRLWDLLNAAGIVTNAAVRNDSLALYVVATGSDGYKAVISMGEIDPGFGNQPDLIAYQLAGAPLTTNGFARLVIPNDTKAGRYVSNLATIEVFAAPAAQ